MRRNFETFLKKKKKQNKVQYGVYCGKLTYRQYWADNHPEALGAALHVTERRTREYKGAKAKDRI